MFLFCKITSLQKVCSIFRSECTAVQWHRISRAPVTSGTGRMRPSSCQVVLRGLIRPSPTLWLWAVSAASVTRKSRTAALSACSRVSATHTPTTKPSRIRPGHQPKVLVANWTTFGILIWFMKYCVLTGFILHINYPILPLSLTHNFTKFTHVK